MSVLWFFLYGLIYSMSENLSIKLGYEHILTVFSLSIFTTILYIYLRKDNQQYIYFACLPRRRSVKDILWLIPFAGLPVANVCLYENYAGIHISILTIIVIAYTTSLEEFFFRGYLYVRFEKKSGWEKEKWKSIIVVNLLFSVLHFANLMNDYRIEYIFIQVICALAIGLCLSMITICFQSLLPATLIHTFINITAEGVQNSSKHAYGIFLILAIFYLIYASALYKKIINEMKRGEHETLY